MITKLSFTVLLSSISLLAMPISQVQTADKKVLGCIKGIGEKRLNNILIYRKEHKLENKSDLLNISGIGKGILKNIEQDIKKKSCLVDKQNSLPKKENKKAIGAK